MPGWRRKTDPEDSSTSDAVISGGKRSRGPDSDPISDPRTQPFTRELLDSLLHTLEAVLRHPVVVTFGPDSAKAGLREALKHADRFYPLTLMKGLEGVEEEVGLPGSGAPVDNNAEREGP